MESPAILGAIMIDKKGIDEGIDFLITDRIIYLIDLSIKKLFHYAQPIDLYTIST